MTIILSKSLPTTSYSAAEIIYAVFYKEDLCFIIHPDM